MKIETAKKAIARLQGFFHRKLTDDAVVFYANEFKRVDDDIFAAAVDEACRAEKSLPTSRLLKEYVAKLQRQKLKAAQPTNFAEIFGSKPDDTECIRESRGVLRRMHQQDLWGDGLIAEMLLMEQAFPGRDWGKEARKLQAHLKKQRDAIYSR